MLQRRRDEGNNPGTRESDAEDVLADAEVVSALLAGTLFRLEETPVRLAKELLRCGTFVGRKG
jgi:hypothetical protein